jgi:hypothetical protein
MIDDLVLISGNPLSTFFWHRSRASRRSGGDRDEEKRSGVKYVGRSIFSPEPGRLDVADSKLL